MIFLGGVSFNIIPCSEHDAQFTEFHCKQFALFLGLLRSVHVIVFLRVIYHIPQVRFYSWMQTGASMVVTACWITMFFVEDIPVLFIALWLTTICIDLFIFFVLVRVRIAFLTLLRFLWYIRNFFRFHDENLFKSYLHDHNNNIIHVL